MYRKTFSNSPYIWGSHYGRFIPIAFRGSGGALHSGPLPPPAIHSREKLVKKVEFQREIARNDAFGLQMALFGSLPGRTNTLEDSLSSVQQIDRLSVCLSVYIFILSFLCILPPPPPLFLSLLYREQNNNKLTFLAFFLRRD